MIVSISTNN